MLAVLMLAVAAPRAEGRESWPSVTGPAAGAAQAIGSGAAGCVRGAETLAPNGENYQVIRPTRHRNWSHPATIRFIHALSASAGGEGIKGLLIADMGQPRGGPMPSGHASHQNGLDVDIWFRLAPKRLGGAELDAPVPVVMVKGRDVDAAVWTPAQARLLQLAAQAPEVERIFVNPAIKRAMCRAAPADDRDWLRKLRPWWGHDEHFHVRLACPPDSPECEVQKPIPEGDGCGDELESWLAKPTSPAPPSRPHHQARPLPPACAAVLNGEGVTSLAKPGARAYEAGH